MLDRPREVQGRAAHPAAAKSVQYAFRNMLLAHADWITSLGPRAPSDDAEPEPITTRPRRRPTQHGQPTHCLRARIDATAHRGRLLRRSAALSASKLRPRPTRCSRPCCNHTASRQPRPSVGPLQRMPRRSRGARGRARIAADAHHGRLLGRSAALSASPARAASHAPRHTPLQPQAGP